jgi:type I site-specific restriction endonuclease
MTNFESERQTRTQRVDRKLRAAGWTIVPFDESRQISGYRAHAIEEYPTANGPVDHALVADGQILGVVEAKTLSLGPGGVLIQSDRYSRGLTNSPFNFRGLRVPFLYSTNGEIIRFHDAHERQYKKALVEIISMVKRAADEHQPLLTAEERMNRAFGQVTARKAFTAEQQLWLERIRQHLIANLSVDEEVFDAVPVLEQAGGWVSANRAFRENWAIYSSS